MVIYDAELRYEPYGVERRVWVSLVLQQDPYADRDRCVWLA